MKVNYHVHCEYSDDSIYPIEEVVKDAINLKIDEICFTDHVDYGIKKDWIEGNIEYRSGEPIANVDYPAYFKAIHMLQEKYKNQISIKKGLEFGMQQHTIPQFKKLFDEYQMGINVTNHDAQSVADAILKAYEDPQLRTRLGENACQYAWQHYSRKENTAKFVALIRTAVEEKR